VLPVQLDEKLLNDIGGWQEMKRAQAIWKSGMVLTARYEPPTLRGMVRDGGVEYRAGLVLKSKINVENICSCQDSRRWGKICGHSLAIGLAAIHGVRNGAMAESPSSKPEPPAAPVAASMPPGFEVAEGAPSTLTLVIPPKWREMIASRQALTVACEWQDASRKKQMLGSLAPGAKHRVDSALAKVLGWIWRVSGRGKLPSMMQLTGESLLELIEEIDPGASRVIITPGRNEPLQIADGPIRPRLEIQPRPDGGIRLEVELLPGFEPVIAGSRVQLWNPPRTLQRMAAPLPAHYQGLLTQPVDLEADQAGPFLEKEYAGLTQWFHPAPLPDELGAHASSQPVPSGEGEGDRGKPDVLLEIDGSLIALTAVLQFRYGKRILTAGVTDRNEAVRYADEQGHQRRRNPTFENQCLERLESWRFSAPDRHGRLTLRGEREILAFFVREFPKLEREWCVTVGERFGRISERFDRVEPEMAIQRTGEDWFEVGVEFASASGKEWSPQEIQRLLRSGRSYEKSDDGRITLFNADDMTSLEALLRDCDPSQRSEGTYRLDRRHASLLDQVAKGRGQRPRLRGRDQLKAWLPDGIDPVQLGPFENVLRPYQKEGVNWMKFLQINGLGGILADEMGLGKTVQTLAFLARIDRAGAPSLIVCPSSIVWNWAEECRRFAPELRVVRYIGSQRSRLRKQLEKADLVLTSYPILRRDRDHLQALHYFAVVLDEAHHIKNPDTQNARAAVDLTATLRLVLTGTPIENSLMDLWSLMEFANPRLLGDRKSFKEAYMSQSTESDIKLLRNRLRPLIKRRTKEEKVRELPPKIVQVQWVECTREQMTCYHSVVKGIDELKQQAKAEQNGSKKRAILLTGLLRLRQASCDLRLLKKDDTSSVHVASGKVAAFGELLQEMLDSGQRVLVFSQFVEMLKLLKRYLEEQEVGYRYLDGSTADREKVVRGFQEGSDPVFLISLKAGGVGLNLTAADAVVLFDPWWNPAVEDQAADRAHRIGQTKPVNVYKMIARQTVEEKILALQEKKRATAHALFEGGELATSGLTTEELESLLEV